MKRLMTTAAALALLMTTAQAGMNRCTGTVEAGKVWTTVKGDLDDYAPNGCRFKTNSPLGRRILTKCPNGSVCEIDVKGLDNRSPTITAIDHVEQAK